MALAAAKERYERGGVSGGSLVRELDWAVRRRELEQAGEVRTMGQIGVRPRNAAKARVRQREKARTHIPILGILSTAAVACMAILLLMGYIELTRLSSETVRLKSQLNELESQHVLLDAQYERMFDRASVQEAAEAAGMTKPSGSQVGYMDLSEGDSVIVYHEEESGFGRGLLLCAKDGFEAVREFFN